MDRLGLGYNALMALNPRLIYCAITGYGYDGPRRSAPATTSTIWRSTACCPTAARWPAGGAGVQIADLGGGALYAALSIVTALFFRERRGAGQFIDIGMRTGLSPGTVCAGASFWPMAACPAGDDFLNHGYACYDLYATRMAALCRWGLWNRNSGRSSAKPSDVPTGTARLFRPGPTPARTPANKLRPSFASVTRRLDRLVCRPRLLLRTGAQSR